MTPKETVETYYITLEWYIYLWKAIESYMPGYETFSWKVSLKKSLQNDRWIPYQGGSFAPYVIQWSDSCGMIIFAPVRTISLQ